MISYHPVFSVCLIRAFVVQDKVSEAKHTIIAVPINNSASAIDTILSICSDTKSFKIGEGWAIRG